MPTNRSADSPVAPLHILLIDPHALFRHGMRYILQELGRPLQIAEADHVREAARVAPERVDLVMLALGYPDLDRLEALHIVRRDFPDSAAVVVSGLDDPALVFDAIEAGALGYIPKSSTASVLISALRLVLVGGVYLPRHVLDYRHVQTGSETDAMTRGARTAADTTPPTPGATVDHAPVSPDPAPPLPSPGAAPARRALAPAAWPPAVLRGPSMHGPVGHTRLPPDGSATAPAPRAWSAAAELAAARIDAVVDAAIGHVSDGAMAIGEPPGTGVESRAAAARSPSVDAALVAPTEPPGGAPSSADGPAPRSDAVPAAASASASASASGSALASASALASTSALSSTSAIGPSSSRTPPRPLAPEAQRALAHLTERQRQVLVRVVRGMSNKAIARELKLSESTVKQHLSSAFKLLGVATRTQAVFTCTQLGLDLRIDGPRATRSSLPVR